MKIMHVCKKYPRAMGGDAIVVANLQKQQQASHHEVVVVTSNCDEIADGTHIYKLGFKDTAAGLDTITIKRLASLVVLFFKMFYILRHERPDVIHTHSIDMAFFASYAARWYGIPMVHTFHIVTFYDAGQSALRTKSELWLARKARLRCATAPNTFDVKKLQEAGLRQTVLLPNGVDLAFWKPTSEVKNSQEFMFLAIGRLELQKGYEYLVKATSLLAQTLPPAFRVTIVGEGSQKVALQKMAQALHIEHLVTLVGSKNPEEVRLLLAGADVAVLPSLYETTPLTLLEAWSATVPAIATSVGILRDIPQDFEAAYVVPPKNEHSLMDAMGRCLKNRTANSVVAANGHEEAKKYTWPTIAHTAESIYRSAQA